MVNLYQDYTSTQALRGQNADVQIRVAERNFRANLRKHFPLDLGARILDVACGYGRYLKTFQQDGYTCAEGIDFSDEQIAFARNYLQLSAVRVGDGFEWMQEHPNSYDVVLLIDVLEHLPREVTIAWLKAAYGALRDNGTLLIQVPNGLTMFSVHYHGDLTHERAYSAAMLAQSFRLAKIVEYAIYPSFDGAPSWPGILRGTLWRRGINPLLTLFTKVVYGTTAGGVFTANLLGVAKKSWDEEIKGVISENYSFGTHRLRLIVLAAGILAAFSLGLVLPQEPVMVASFCGILAAMFLWVVILPRYWWAALPAAAGFGGTFLLSVKIYPLEMALALSMVPLVISLAMRRSGLLQKRPYLDWACYALMGYLFLHWVGSNYFNRYILYSGGLGNVTRAYMSAVWGMGFVCFFNRWGSSSIAGIILRIIYVTTIVRVGLGAYSYFTASDGYIEWLRYSLSADDMRSSGIAFGLLSVGYFCLSKRLIAKVFYAGGFAVAGLAVLAGSSRACLAVFILVPAWVALVHRRYILLGTLGAAVGIGIVFLNCFPSLLDNFDSRVQRTFSILLVDEHIKEQYGRTSTSDYWHERLREIAYERWSDNPASLVVGTGIREFDENTAASLIGAQGVIALERAMLGSASVGAYESGFWTVLTVTGIIGLFLYGRVLWIGFKSCWYYLLRDGIATPAHVFAFVGLVLTGSWVLLFWTYGGYPSSEIMYAFLGKLALDDAQRKAKASAESAITTLPPSSPHQEKFRRPRQRVQISPLR